MGRKKIKKTKPVIAVQQEDSDSDDTKRVMETSLMEAQHNQETSIQREEEDKDLDKAIGLSLISEKTRREAKQNGEHEIDSETEIKEAIRLSLLDCDNSLALAKGRQKKAGASIDMSDDEFDSLCAGPSKSLQERLTNVTSNTSSILIESDASPVNPKKKPVNKKKRKSKPDPITEQGRNCRNPARAARGANIPNRRTTTRTTYTISSESEVDSEREEGISEEFVTAGSELEDEGSDESWSEEDSDESFTPNNIRAGRTGNKRRSGHNRRADPLNESLSTEAASRMMRNVFESGLAIHLSGEEMEACRAVTTPLFPHQRVALAWMFRHENNEDDGMRGGILADDMGLGKTLSVISLIMTNHWDGKPLCKPELGFIRPPFSLGQRGKGKVGGAFRPKVSAEALGVGKYMRESVAKKTTIGGLFDKFNESSGSDSEKENNGKFRFNEGKETKKKGFEKQFIDESNSEADDVSEDEFDKMSRNEMFFKSKKKDAFRTIENPADKSEESDNNENMTQEELMQLMIPTALDGTFDIEFEPKLNVDGFLDDSSSDEDRKSSNRKKQRRDKHDFDSEEDLQMTTPRQQKKRKVNAKENKQKQKTEKRLKTSKTPPSSDGESDISLPEVSPRASSSVVRGEPSKNDTKTNQNNTETETTRINEETGLKLIIPPKVPAIRNGRRRSTLLVCPTSLISHWVDQLQEHLHKSVDIKLKVHHGASKALTGADLECHDIVITTYGTLAAECGAEDLSPLFRAKWLRVVLDEGHYIKNHNTKSAKAAKGLDTLRRWIVTGTPIQNNLLELWSLVNWLNFGLYAGKSKLRCFKKQIEWPCKKGNPQGFERLQVLMDTICLRRTKADRKPDGSPLVALPKKKILTRVVEMNEEERLCYGIYHKRAQDIVGRYHRKGQLLRNYAHVFALMTRLRQLCCHRELIKEVDWVEALKDKKGLTKQLEGFLDKAGITNKKQGADDMNKDTDEELEKQLMRQLREMIRSGVSDDCSVCLDDLKTPVITPCAHVFCRFCIEKVIETIKPPTCPLCRSKIKNKNELLEAGQDDEDDEETDNTLAALQDIHVNVSSSKVNAVLKELLRIQRDLPEDKIIIVSQFTSYLSVLQPLMKENNFSFARLDGSMSHFDRSEIVREFQSGNKNSPTVLLLSLKAGGVGLNLTAANHLLLLDPAWNPASEWQCFDRTHRLGQKKDVTIYKYITKDSIEEKMLEIQAKKKDLISGAFQMPADERRMQRVEDIRNIFDI